MILRNFNKTKALQNINYLQTDSTIYRKIVKNKMAPPFRVASFDITFGEGISKNGEIIDLGAEHDIIQKSGSWYSYGGAKIAQGREGAKQFMDENQEVAHELELKIKEKFKSM